MTTRTVLVKNKIGFHARPAARLIATAKKYKCRFTLTKNSRSTDLRSMVDLLCLQVKMGDRVEVSAEGEDETAAVKAVVELIESKFGEE